MGTDEVVATTALHADSIELVFIGWIIAVVGWLVNAEKNRQLQRKQIAIALLFDNRFEPHFVDAMQKVFYILNHNSNFHWKDLAGTYFGDGTLEKDDQTIMDALKVVLNYFELVAVAVLNEAASEDVIKWAYEKYYRDLSTKLGDFFEEARRKTEGAVWINVTTLATNWSPKPEEARPSN